MIGASTNWQQIRSLARKARIAGARRQTLEVRLSPDESKALADVLDGVFEIVSAVAGERAWSLDEPDADELSYLAAEGGGFGWLAEEPEVYDDNDLQERFEWEQK